MTLQRPVFSLLVVLGLVVVACARPQYVSDQRAALQAPVTLGEGNTGKPPLPTEPDAESASADSNGTNARGATSKGATSKKSSPTGFDFSAQPDPSPTETQAYYELELRHCEGNVYVVHTQRVELDRPTTLPTKMGRFAVELWIGHELLERSRFDFPLLGAETNESGLYSSAKFGPKADVTWTVLVSERVRANQAWVVDRLTGKRWDLDWPPGDTPRAARSKEPDEPCPSPAEAPPTNDAVVPQTSL